MITIVRIGQGATIQDRGRSGLMHEGVPPGGPLVPELLDAANASLGNDPSAAALEIPAGAVLCATGVVSLNGAPRRLAGDATVELEAAREGIAYVAVPGGIDVPVVLGSRGTLLVAGLGGLEGRALRAGDVLRAREARSTAGEACPIAPFDSERPVRVVLGPDRFSSRAVEALLKGAFRMGAADRVGARLSGSTIPVAGGDAARSLPMVRGSIQVTRDGTPIVLGPDHPTTGGYPVIAVIRTADLGLFARRPVGAPVRFSAD